MIAVLNLPPEALIEDVRTFEAALFERPEAKPESSDPMVSFIPLATSGGEAIGKASGHVDVGFGFDQTKPRENQER